MRDCSASSVVRESSIAVPNPLSDRLALLRRDVVTLFTQVGQLDCRRLVWVGDDRPVRLPAVQLAALEQVIDLIGWQLAIPAAGAGGLLMTTDGMAATGLHGWVGAGLEAGLRGVACDALPEAWPPLLLHRLVHYLHRNHVRLSLKNRGGEFNPRPLSVLLL